MCLRARSILFLSARSKLLGCMAIYVRLNLITICCAVIEVFYGYLDILCSCYISEELDFNHDLLCSHWSVNEIVCHLHIRWRELNSITDNMYSAKRKIEILITLLASLVCCFVAMWSRRLLFLVSKITKERMVG